MKKVNDFEKYYNMKGLTYEARYMIATTDKKDLDYLFEGLTAEELNKLAYELKKEVY